MAEILTPATADRRVYFFENVTSTLDKSFELIARGGMDVWDSVVAASQTNGRGQMRRHWLSPEGNLHASLRLPFCQPFTTPGAAVAASALCMLALRRLGVDVRIKWPNDLVVLQGGLPLKAGGLLMEQHSYSIVAGIGINIKVVPEIARENGDIPIARLQDFYDAEMWREVEELWRAIVKNMIEEYNNSLFSATWRNIALECMVWLGKKVRLVDGSACQTGILAGLDYDGRIELETQAGKMAFGYGALVLDE